MYAAFQYTNMEDLVTKENASSQISTVNPGPYVLVNLGGVKKNWDSTIVGAFKL